MVRLRAFGMYSFRISNPQVFVNTVVGTLPELASAAVDGFFRGFIVNQVADFLGSHLSTILDLAQYYVELSAGIQARLISDFEKYGVTLADFKILSISPPDHVQEMIDKRGGMAAVGSLDSFVRYQAANALEKAAGSGGGGGAGLAAAGVGAGAGLGLGAGMAGVVTNALGGDGGGRCDTERAWRAARRVAAGANFCSRCGVRQGRGRRRAARAARRRTSRTRASARAAARRSPAQAQRDVAARANVASARGMRGPYQDSSSPSTTCTRPLRAAGQSSASSSSRSRSPKA